MMGKLLSRWGVVYAVVLAVVLAVPLVCLPGCGGGGGDGGGGGNVNTMEQVAAQVSQIITGNIDYANLAASLQTITNLLVQQVGGQVAGFETGPDYITVIHENLSRETWFYNPLFAEPADGTQVKPAVATKAVVGNQQAIVMDVLAGDPVFAAQHGAVLASIRSQFTAQGFTVHQVDGASANIEAFKHLGGAGAVFVITHGCATGDGYFLETGEAVTTANRTTYMTDWEGDFLRPSHPLYPGSPGVGTAKWMVSHHFFSREYAAGAFPGTLFYNGACQGTTNSLLSSVLESKGVACYIGWSQSQGVSPWHAHSLFGLMGDGSTVASAMPRVPTSLSQWLSPPAVPQLGGGSDSSTQLKSGGTTGLAVDITSPANGATIEGNAVTVQGTVSPMSADVYATITVNGTDTPLSLTTGGSFSTIVNLITGANTIVVTAMGNAGAGSDSITVTSTQEPVGNALEVVCNWSSAAVRVDLHVIRVTNVAALVTMPTWGQAEWTAFLNTEDCSVNHPSSAWGGLWNTAGGTQQTVILPNPPSTATYYAVVTHYFGTPPLGGSTSAVSVSGTVDTLLQDATFSASLTNGGALTGTDPFDVFGVAVVSLPAGIIDTSLSGTYTVYP